VESVIGDARMTGAHDKLIALNNAGKFRVVCRWRACFFFHLNPPVKPEAGCGLRER